MTRVGVVLAGLVPQAGFSPELVLYRIVYWGGPSDAPCPYDTCCCIDLSLLMLTSHSTTQSGVSHTVLETHPMSGQCPIGTANGSVCCVGIQLCTALALQGVSVTRWQHELSTIT